MWICDRPVARDVPWKGCDHRDRARDVAGVVVTPCGCEVRSRAARTSSDSTARRASLIVSSVVPRNIVSASASRAAASDLATVIARFS